MSSRSIAPFLFVLLLLTLPACGAGGPAPEPPAAAEPSTGVEVTYIGNEGVLLRAGENAVLIDALYRDGVSGYAVHPSELRESLESAAPPFDGIDLLLATHQHADHFDAGAVARHLEHNPTALFVSTPQAVARLHAELEQDDPRRERVRAVYPEEGQRVKLTHRGVRLEAMNLHHGRGSTTENLGFLVDLGGRRVLHVGDTDANADDFLAQRLVEDRIDVGLIPFWHLVSDTGRARIAETVSPRALLAIHIPPESARDAWIEEEMGGWRTMVDVVLGDQAGAVALTEPMQSRTF